MSLRAHTHGDDIRAAVSCRGVDRREVGAEMSKPGDIWKSPGGEMTLYCGDWREVLAHVRECDAVITDPPYSEKVHKGYNNAVRETRGLKGSCRTQLSYGSLSIHDVAECATAWAGIAKSWVVPMCDDNLISTWKTELAKSGMTTFQAVPCLLPGMTVRLAGDGPSSWAVYLTPARSKAACRWGTIQGGYHGSPARGGGHIGGKPLWLMRAIIKDYSRPGDLIVDPCAGGGTTLLAAAIEGRRAIGAELDPETFDKAVKRLSCGYTPSFLPLLEEDHD